MKLASKAWACKHRRSYTGSPHPVTRPNLESPGKAGQVHMHLPQSASSLPACPQFSNLDFHAATAAAIPRHFPPPTITEVIVLLFTSAAPQSPALENLFASVAAGATSPRLNSPQSSQSLSPTCYLSNIPTLLQSVQPPPDAFIQTIPKLLYHYPISYILPALSLLE
ncbi:hypothetical protein PG985_005853 [Apiospora marii]|uniref:uncharacterized protein n=1 Tax=Apiospora marii TaxID=335849 RepID=UPI0031306926